MQANLHIAVIGGGAAGFFAAISCKTHNPNAEVTLYEKTDKLLAKVKISGGGRCNVTHACFTVSQLAKYYPRGERYLKKAFSYFSTIDTVQWFESRGVKLKTEDDNRVFPVTDDSQTIINCLLRETEKLGVSVEMKQPVMAIEKESNGFKLAFRDKAIHADKVIIANGGSPKKEGFDWLEQLGHEIESPVPSLFTFNMPIEPIKTLMGVSVESAAVRIIGTKLKSEGPLLITHWGMSGPAILKLSAWGARILHDLDYKFSIMVNWLGNMNEDEARDVFSKERDAHPNKKTGNSESFKMPGRLWLFLLSKLDINPEITLERLGKKNMNRLLNLLLNDEYKVEGKTTFKEEFVTCGGVSLSNVSMDTMESKVCPGMYFAGEVLDIDGVTGGFNFQAAWTTGFIAGKLGSSNN
ncbi:MAG TPA: NAD(P)/FAD-dependent oxidoreductase [Bacteroidia bacterium]|jgi:predicted Rossmann fold flavoprotein|nr:NAD(P)/FAD-dependent oxidoreductase [Bacteroidia bacterium]